jgi:hypothetical protein
VLSTKNLTYRPCYATTDMHSLLVSNEGHWAVVQITTSPRSACRRLRCYPGLSVFDCAMLRSIVDFAICYTNSLMQPVCERKKSIAFKAQCLPVTLRQDCVGCLEIHAVLVEKYREAYICIILNLYIQCWLYLDRVSDRSGTGVMLPDSRLQLSLESFFVYESECLQSSRCWVMVTFLCLTRY